MKGILVALAFSLLLFGCVQQTETPSPTPIEITTPMPTPVPTVEVTATPTPEVPPLVEIIELPLNVESGKEFSLRWRVMTGQPASIQHTAVHYGTTSVPVVGTSTAPTATGYTGLTPVQSGNVPGFFTALITISQPGIIYARAHAIINGKHYWGREINFTVK